MPKIGDILRGRDLGKKGRWEPGKKCIYCVCPECGKERWLNLRKENANGISRCQSCCAKYVCINWIPHGRGPESPHWKGGRHLQHQGYVLRWISEDDPYYSMATHKRRGGGGIFEHRLVMAQSLNRCLTRQEHVHHRNGVKSDNSLANLELISPASHMLYNKLCVNCPLRKQVRQLKRENKELRKLLPHLI